MGSPRRVLVTGFGPFLSHDINPTEALARRIGGRRVGGVAFRSLAPLPVVFGEAARLVLRASSDVDAVVALGLAGGSRRIRLETRGRNRSTSARRDTRGGCQSGRAIVPGAPPTRSASLPVEPVARALAFAGVRSERSGDAGGYVCNDLYYRLLQAGRTALFVHVPSEIDVRRVAQPLARGIAAAVRSL